MHFASALVTERFVQAPRRMAEPEHAQPERKRSLGPRVVFGQAHAFLAVPLAEVLRFDQDLPDLPCAGIIGVVASAPEVTDLGASRVTQNDNRIVGGGVPRWERASSGCLCAPAGLGRGVSGGGENSGVFAGAAMQPCGKALGSSKCSLTCRVARLSWLKPGSPPLADAVAAVMRALEMNKKFVHFQHWLSAGSVVPDVWRKS